MIHWRVLLFHSSTLVSSAGATTLPGVWITGLTPVGRATIESLQLNREGLVNMRRVLHAVGEHPPQEPD
jgi:hypothetical protein